MKQIILILFLGIGIVSLYLYSNLDNFSETFTGFKKFDEMDEIASVRRVEVKKPEVPQDTLKVAEKPKIEPQECPQSEVNEVVEYIEVPVIEYTEICSNEENIELKKLIKNLEQEVRLFQQTAGAWKYRYCADLGKDNHCI